MKLMQELTKRYAPDFKGRLLDVGSKDVNGSYRTIFSNAEYLGLDVETEKGVDIVVKNPYRWSEIDSDSFDLVISG